MAHRLSLVFVMIATAVGVAAADEGAKKTVKRSSPPLGCDRLTTADGLPNANVRAIVQDKRGFIWLGTEDGLARYDGTRFRVYRAVENDATSISPGFITDLQIDADDKLWVSLDTGVSMYDPETDTFTRYARGSGGLSSEGVTAITRDAKDRLWFAMSGGGVDRFDPAQKKFEKHVEKPLDVVITAMDTDAAGNLWLGTAGDGVLRWNPDNRSTLQLSPAQLGIESAQISTIEVTKAGTAWIGTDGEGMRAFAPESKQVKTYRTATNDPATIGDDHVAVIFEDNKGTLWIGTRIGLDRIDGSGALVRFHHDPEQPADSAQLSVPWVVSIFQDRGNLMWLGGFTGGVCKFDEHRRKLGYYRTKAHATAYWEEPDGTLWVGTYYTGLYKYEFGAQRATIYHTLGTSRGGGELGDLSSAWITSLHRDRRGTLWVALQTKGLVAFDSKTESYKWYLPNPDEPNTLPADTVWDIWEDANGRLWLATWGGGLVRFDPQVEVFTAYMMPESGDDANAMSSNHLYTLYPDPKDPNVLWVGTAKGGLVRFVITSGSATSYRHDADNPATLTSDDVVGIYRDDTGMLWVTTFGAGINRLDPDTKKVERFTTANSGLPNNTSFAILPDGTGKLWMSTNGNGLVEFDPKTKTFTQFDVADGAQNNEFVQGAALRAGSGKLIFGGVSGFNAFYPKDITRDTYAPPVALTAFKLFNQDIKLPRPIWTLPEIEVSYSDSFEVQFAALSFAAPTKNRYAYKLEGFDDKFIETDRPYATYTKLDGGNYKLRVKTANRHGVWNEAGVTLAISVRPPWWRTWQAFGAYLLALIGIVYLVFRIQRERLRRAEREGRLAVVERDLELTGAVQTGFLPEHNEIRTDRLHLFGLYRPADACGGDWWWYEPLPGGRHIIMVGDVTGHGPGPAMVTAAVATAFRVLLESGLEDVPQSLELLNKEVLRVAKGKYHMTMAALELDEATGRWILYSAGAPPILSLGASGKHKVHFCAGAPLGTETGFEVGRLEGKLEPTDRMLLYTDGIPEIALPNGNVLGMRRFGQQYEQTKHLPLPSAAAHIVAHADHIRAGQPQSDDWTFAMLEWN